MVVRSVMATLAAWDNGGKSNGIPALDLGALCARTVAPRSTSIGGISTSSHLQYRLEGRAHYWVAFGNVVPVFTNIVVPN